MIDHQATSAQQYLKREPRDSDVALSKLEAQIAHLEARVEEALADPMDIDDSILHKPDAVTIWGVPFSRLTLEETLQHVERLIQNRQPGYFITANLNYNMLTYRHPELRQVNDDAAFIVCDGMPIVWRSRFTTRPLPERVAGSELIYAITQWAAHHGHRIYFLGGAPGVAQSASDQLAARYPGLQIAGVCSPPFRPLSDDEQQEILADIRATAPDIVYVAFGQPKGELWMAKNYKRIGAPVCVQIGASFDFVAGGVARAPMWVQKVGFEWCYRLLQEPRRLVGRYWQNAVFLLRSLSQEIISAK